MSSLQEATEKWRQASAKRDRAYELLIDRAMEVQSVKSEYGRMEAMHRHTVAKLDYELSRDEATEARIAMTDMAARISAIG